MRKFLLAFLPMILLILQGYSQAGMPYTPDFSLSPDDFTHQVLEPKSEIWVLDFWASWCGPCRQSFPWMNDMQARHGARGLQVVGVNLDAKRADADAFLAAVPAKFPIVFDPQGQTPRRYAVKGMPSSVLIGPDGRVLSQHAGFRDDDRGPLENRLVAALEGLRR